MKHIRLIAVFAFLVTMLPFASHAEEHGGPHRSEIRVINDTDSQISFYITTEKHGRLQWTWGPGKNSYPSVADVRLRVRDDDPIEIADWGRAHIGDLAEYRDGAWTLSLRHAAHELHRHERDR